jgi:MOSC domain-containing protein YiiM
MGDKVRLGLYDAVGKLCEVVEVDKECVEFDAFDDKKVFIECEELQKELRGWDVRVIEEEEEFC